MAEKYTIELTDDEASMVAYGLKELGNHYSQQAHVCGKSYGAYGDYLRKESDKCRKLAERVLSRRES